MHRQQNHLAQQMHELDDYLARCQPNNTHTPKSTGPERLIIMGPGAALSTVAAKFALQSHCKPHSARKNVRMQLSRAILGRHRFHELALANQTDSCYINEGPTRPLSQNHMASHIKLEECRRRHTVYCAPTQTPTEEPFCSQPGARKTTCTMCVKSEASSCASFTMLR